MRSEEEAVLESSPSPPIWRRPAAMLGVALGVMLAGQIGWLALNQRPVEYDSAWYLETAVSLRRTLLEQGGAAFLDRARAAFGFKAPGVSMAAALVMATVGESPGIAVAVSLGAWLVAAAYLYLFARRFISPEASALAALLASAMPAAFSLARSLLVEASLTAAVVAFLFHVAASERLRRPGHVAALAGWGVIGLMVKVTFPVYVVVPALFLTVNPWREARPRMAWLLTGWALVAGTAAGAAAWLWYAANWRTTLDYTRNAGFGALSDAYAVPLPTFAAAVAGHAASPWMLASAVVLVALGLRRPRQEADDRRLPLVVLAWIVPPLLMVISSSNRYGRYLAATLPALALAVAALAEPWLRRSGRAAALTCALLAGPPLAIFTIATFPTPLAGAMRGWVEAQWLGNSVNWYEGPPDQRPWPNRDIVTAAGHGAGSGPPVIMRLNVDLPELNHNNLKVEALLQRVEVIPAQIDQGSPEGALATAFDGDLLLVQVGGEVAADFLNVQRGVVAREAASGRHPYREIGRFELPGARAVALLERRCDVDAGGAAGSPLATLERGLELVAFDVARPVEGLVSVRTRYRIGIGSHPMLAAVIELTDGAGRSLGTGEHPLCRRPRRPWPAGVVVEDTFFLPAWSVASGVGLRLGLRDLLTGAPLRVERVGAGLALAGGRVEFARLGERLSPASIR
jgi:hypothetical protein